MTEVKTMAAIRTLNPATNEIVKEFEEMTPAQIETKLAIAHATFQQWKKTRMEDRAKLLRKLSDLIEKRTDAIAKLFALEMGKRYEESVDEINICVDILTYYADYGAELLRDKPLKVPFGKAFISYEPIGIILSVQPWNFPFYQLIRSAAPNVMSGNCVFMKHASIVPMAGQLMEDLFREAGAPEGLYTNIYVTGSHVSSLLDDPRICGAALTGSDAAGASFASRAGKNVLKVSLELGGSDVFLVMPDANIDKAVEMACLGRLWNAGQVCISPKRILVMESMAEQFTNKAKAFFEKMKVGDPLDRKTDLGPLSSDESLQRILNQVTKAIEQGAHLVMGGKRMDRAGFFMQPTILTGITPAMDAYHEELFGPVLMIYSVRNMEDAIQIANDTKYGLGGTVFGKDVDEAVKVARRIETGMVYINHLTGIAAELPFGGAKRSGYGREQAEDGIYEFVNPKLIRISTPESPY